MENKKVEVKVEETNVRKLEVFKVEMNEAKTDAVILCVDREANNMFEPRLSKTKYDEASGTYKPDAGMAEFTEKICQEVFGCAFEDLASKIGEKVDVYVYDDKSSFYPMKSYPKTDVIPTDLVGKIKKGIITDILQDDKGTIVYIEYEGMKFKQNFIWAKYDMDTSTWFIIPTQKPKKAAKFVGTFGVTMENAPKLIGKEIMFEAKNYFGGKKQGIEIKGE